MYLMLIVVIALVREDNSIMDIAYGAGFVLIAWCLAFMWPTWTDRQVIVLTCITVWGVRLATRILLRNWGKPEDFRYQVWRNEWKKKGMLYFFCRSMAQIYLLQGVVILVVLLPVLVVFATTQGPLIWYNWLGLGLWCVGFVFEFVGDFQLDRFIRNRDNTGKIMTSGLWRFTRHPNYFGEATMWWGLYLVVLGLPLSHLAFLSPILITFLLTQVSGIPMLEKRWAGRADWEAYKRKTSAFIPWFPKEV
jgi:steroid 5-alpha reductase family enzyme